MAASGAGAGAAGGDLKVHMCFGFAVDGEAGGDGAGAAAGGTAGMPPPVPSLSRALSFTSQVVVSLTCQAQAPVAVERQSSMELPDGTPAPADPLSGLPPPPRLSRTLQLEPTPSKNGGSMLANLEVAAGQVFQQLLARAVPWNIKFQYRRPLREASTGGRCLPPMPATHANLSGHVAQSAACDVSLRSLYVPAAHALSSGFTVPGGQ